jgi:hypothetical protein
MRRSCPADLLQLVERGVSVYSVSNLHAKVFVVGRAAYVGSTNVSSRSATQLIEAVIRTTEPSIVRFARLFVEEHCLHELTPSVLRRLQKLYQPPRAPGGKRFESSKTEVVRRPSLPRLLLAQLVLEEDWSERDQALHDAAMVVAKKRRKHARSCEMDSFRYPGQCPFARGDAVIQVTDEGKGETLVSPPGNVLHVRTRRRGKRSVSFVYLECPARRRRPIQSLGRALGRGALARLRREGVVRYASFAQALLNAWAR